MQVKLLCPRVGTRFSQVAGEIIEVSDREGESIIAAGQAVPVPAKKRDVEKATRSARENAAGRK